ncbi:MAG TPA: SGNH/GDSL hydrolase family protein [Nocardioides sp.]|nr:SGNH/GDSL hydrolase family protein [Nocardioides sp.]
MARESSLGLSYVALGDSFTAAPGVGDPTGPAACFRTDANYPHLLAERLGLDLVDVSCAGATSRDLRSPQPAVGAAAQLDAVTAATELVTLSIGANDDGLFGALATQCAGLAGFGQEAPAASCVSDERFAEDRLAAELSALSQETVRSVRAIRRRAPDAEVVVIGYPQLVPARGTCEVLPLDADEVPFVREINRRLAAAVEEGARTARVAYVDMWAASEGHDACAAEPWVAGLRPVGPGAPLHPYPAHQAAVADAVAALLP